MKCPKCGSEYHSNAPTCYACSRLERSAEGSKWTNWRGASTLSTGVVSIAVGIILVLSAAYLVPDGDWKGLVVFGVFVTSLGASILSYSILYTKTSLRDLRSGKEPGSRLAAGFAATGLGMMLFIEGYLIAAYRIEFSPSFEALGLLLPLSVALIVTGSFRRPRFLFQSDEVEWGPSRRATVGGSILATGFVIQTATLACGYWMSLETLQSVGWSLLLLGPFMVIAGLSILWGPMGRPWIPGEHRIQNEEET